MRPLPIRLRLTVWYFTLFATAALLLSLTSWWMLRRTIEMTLHQDLQERVDDVRVELEQLGPHFTSEQARDSFDAIYRLRDDGKWIQIFDQTGRCIYRSSRMTAQEAVLSAPRTVPLSGITGEFVQGGHSVRTLTLIIAVNGVNYTVETGISMKKPSVLLREFGLSLLFITPAVALIAAFAGHLVSRKALAPVALIVNEARRISDRNLETRLPVSPAKDELSDLSLTLNNMLARIDAGFRSVRDFTANASHELRTPLARLRTEVEIALLLPREAAEYRDSLEHVDQAAIDMSSIIDSLLTIARAEVGTEILRLTPVDLGSLLNSIMDEWTPIAGRLGIHFRANDISASDHTIYVLGDRLSLVRLLRMLLDNAFKFTLSGGTVAIIVEAREENVLLTVKDNGVGIAPEHHAVIFDRFFRVYGDTAKQHSGAGLGLSLAAWIAEQHKTTITVDSLPGAGASFQIALTRAWPDELTITQIIRSWDLTQSPTTRSQSLRGRIDIP